MASNVEYIVDSVLDEIEDSLAEGYFSDADEAFLQVMDGNYPVYYAEALEIADKHNEVYDQPVPEGASTVMDAVMYAVYEFLNEQVMSHPDFDNLREFGVRQPE